MAPQETGHKYGKLYLEATTSNSRFNIFLDMLNECYSRKEAFCIIFIAFHRHIADSLQLNQPQKGPQS